ncbi:MAG: hypothetical protein HY721_35100 [Planctomycetes bacterium]|nr:hypothetical protein [Planctomycetota bacterium]
MIRRPSSALVALALTALISSSTGCRSTGGCSAACCSGGPKVGPTASAAEKAALLGRVKADDSFMGEMTLTFVDADTIHEDWQSFKDGKPAGTAHFELKRKKLGSPP